MNVNRCLGEAPACMFLYKNMVLGQLQENIAWNFAVNGLQNNKHKSFVTKSVYTGNS